MTMPNDTIHHPFTQQPPQKTSGKPFNVAELIRSLPENATPAQQDSIVQAHLPQRPKVRSSCPDTLGLPGLPPKETYILEEHMFEYRKSFFDNSIFMHPELSSSRLGIQEELTAYQLKKDDGITSIIITIFMLLIMIIAKGQTFLPKQIKSLFYPPKEYHSLFQEESGDQQRLSMLLICLTIIIQALLIFSFNEHTVEDGHIFKTPGLLLSNVGILAGYYLLKHFGYSFVNWIFFDKKNRKRWNEIYDIVQISTGILLFPALLLTIYFGLETSQALIYLLLITSFGKIILLYEAYITFFPKFYGIMHLFVYFCALEITPLLVTGRILIYLNTNLIIKF